MNFMKAFKEMKKGKKVRRSIWHKNLVLWLELENNDFCKNQLFGGIVEYNYIVPPEIEANDWEISQ